MQYPRDQPLRIDGSSWKSALAIPRFMWGLMLLICSMSVVFPFRFEPVESPRELWWVVPLVSSVLFAAGFLMPAWLEVRGVAKKRPKADDGDDGRVFRSAKKARAAYVEAASVAHVAAVGFPTLAALGGSFTYMDSGHWYAALPFILGGTITVALRFPRAVDWQARAEAAYGARFPEG